MRFAVKTDRFSVDHIVSMSKHAESGMRAAGLIHQVGRSGQMFHRWKDLCSGRSGGVDASKNSSGTGGKGSES
jgi:hypothetical protein